MIKVTVDDTAPCQKALSIEIPAERVREEFEKTLQAYRKNAKIAGFRPGKAPENLVRNRYKRQIEEDLREHLVPVGYQEAVKQEKLNVATVIDVADVSFQADAPMTFRVTVDVHPEFELPSYTGIPLTREPKAVGDEEIEKVFQDVVSQHGTYETVEDRPVQRRDFVQVDFVGTVDGVNIEELEPAAKGLGNAKDFWVRADEEAFIPEFGEELVGMEAGVAKEFDIRFPDDFRPEALAGKLAHFAATVKSIRWRKPPELNEAFFSQLGVASEEEMRTRIREELGRSEESRQERELRSQLTRHLLNEVTMDLPGSEVERETRRIIQDIVRNERSRGAERGQIEQHKDAIFNAASANAQDTVRFRYILGRIAEKESISVTKEEFDRHLGLMAQAYGMDEPRLRSELQSRNALEGVAEELRNRKTVDFLLEKASISG